jgi:outer membrane protein OmpU
MNKLRKIGLTALGASLVVSSAYAGELSVSGSATLDYTSKSNGSNSNPLSMGNSVKFTGSGELDNGTTFTAYWELDNDVMDDYNMNFGLPNDMGTITFIGDSGLAGGIAKVADIVPTAFEEVYDVTDAVDNGIATYTLSTNPNIGYTWSGAGLMLSAHYNPEATGGTGSDSETSYGATYEVPGTDGLMIAAGTASSDLHSDINTLGAKYTVGGVTAAYQWTETDKTTTNVDQIGTHYGISFAINENLTVSAGRMDVEFRDSPTLVDETNTGFSASYTMGGMTIAATLNEEENSDGSSTAKDVQTSILNLAFAF